MDPLHSLKVLTVEDLPTDGEVDTDAVAEDISDTNILHLSTPAL
jgi:hypothetical protein